MFRREENCEEEGRIPLLERVPSLDDLSRELASDTISRGRAIKLTAGALLGTALIPLFSSPAEARRRRRNPCKGKTPICTSTPGTTENCKGNSQCFCARTVEGRKKCVDITLLACPSTNECDSSRDCSADEFCLVLSACCGNTNNACVRRCPREAP